MWVPWKRNLPSAPANIFDFNHIDPDIPAESAEMLKKLYAFYHKKYWCYAEVFRIFKRQNLFCNAMGGKTIISSAGAGELL